MYRHTYRGQVWHIVQNPTTGRCQRLRPAAYRIVGLMDGVRTLDQIWEYIRDPTVLVLEDRVIRLSVLGWTLAFIALIYI